MICLQSLPLTAAGGGGETREGLCAISGQGVAGCDRDRVTGTH